MNENVLRPISDDYVARLESVVGQRDHVENIVARVSSRDPRTIFFAGSGSSYYNLGASWHVLELLSPKLAPFLRSTSRLAARPSPLIGPMCVMVAASESGRTEESVETMLLARSLGALTIGITSEKNTPFAQAADELLIGGDAETMTESVHILSLFISYAVLKQAGVALPFSSVWKAFELLPTALQTLLNDLDDSLATIAERISNVDLTTVLSGGPNYGVAAGARRSFLTEPRHIEPRYSESESVHGTFDTIDENMQALVYLGEDESREEMQEVFGFTRRHSIHAELIDSRSFTMAGIDEVMRPHIMPVVLAAVSRRLSEHIETLSGYKSVNY